VRSRDEVLPASSLLSFKRQGNEVELGKYPDRKVVEVYFDKYFPHKGVLLEMWFRDFPTSRRIKKYHRSLIAVDFFTPCAFESKGK